MLFGGAVFPILWWPALATAAPSTWHGDGAHGTIGAGITAMRTSGSQGVGMQRTHGRTREGGVASGGNKAAGQMKAGAKTDGKIVAIAAGKIAAGKILGKIAAGNIAAGKIATAGPLQRRTLCSASQNASRSGSGNPAHQGIIETETRRAHVLMDTHQILRALQVTRTALRLGKRVVLVHAQ